MSYVTGLKCRACGNIQAAAPIAGCGLCFAPLEVDYDYDAIACDLKRDEVERRPRNLWRWRELLPLTEEPRVGLATGGTPLLRAPRLGAALGLPDLYLKDDTVNHPTLSFKDRVTAVAINKSMEFGFTAVGCASTGNLANSVAATAAAAGIPAYIFIPGGLEQAKIVATQVYGATVVAVRGTYDQVNRLCTMIADTRKWGLVNVNLRPYYAEGSKTVAYEIARDLEWQAPHAVVVPMAGGSLITKVDKGLRELQRLKWIPPAHTRIYGAQAEGCNPIVAAVQAGTRDIVPVKPNTIARSLSIGNPADGYFATGVIEASGGWADSATDGEIIDGIQLLARTEGIFAETAGGVVVAVTRKLVAQGRLRPADRVVLAITGNGLKTQEALHLAPPVEVDARLDDFEKLLCQLESSALPPAVSAPDAR